ncbi:MAG: hypothetical protein BroJett018_46150 [Chloroflexota bacterium]|nr:MAG: hypothetical protein BroJett018_46150 [Chloroflexota bacterium]
MYDLPDASRLIEAVYQHLEMNIAPMLKADAAQRKLYFQTLVAINVLKVAERELVLRPRHLKAEWGRLNRLQEIDLHMPENSEELADLLARRNIQLCTDIRDGQYDSPENASALLAHLMMTVQEQLEVANPRFLQGLAAEDAAKR